MELQRRQDQGFPERKGQKRKLEEELEEESEISAPPPTGDARDALLAEVTAQVDILDSTFSWKEADRAAAKRATHVLAELAKNGKIYSLELSFRSRRTLLRLLGFHELRSWCSFTFSVHFLHVW